MRIIVFFDLPTITVNDRRDYRAFRKILLKRGFIMLQESVYCRMALNKNVAAAIIQGLRQNKPLGGLVQILTVTEKQFSKMEYIVGEYKSEVIDSDERVVIL